MPKRPLLVDHAQQKYYEASQWWLAHDLAIYRYRNWMLLWMSRKHLRLKLTKISKVAPHRLHHLELLVAEAHDRMLLEAENVRTTARCASSAEMAGRIYDEEHDGREAYRLKQEIADE